MIKLFLKKTVNKCFLTSFLNFILLINLGTKNV